MSRCFASDFQKLDMKSAPRSETISVGVPCFAMTQVMTRLASPSTESVAMVGMNSPIFVYRSTITRIESYEEEGGSPVMKSIAMAAHGRSGMERNLSGPYAAWRDDLARVRNALIFASA